MQAVRAAFEKASSSSFLPNLLPLAGQGLVLLADVKAVRPEFKCNTCHDLVTVSQICTDSMVNKEHQFFPGNILY